MLNWKYLVRLPEKELGKLDIALVNLACAASLTKGIDVSFCLRTLDEWTYRVKSYTERCFQHFQKKPWDYYNSEAYYRALTLVTVLQRDCGLRYNPAKTSPEVPFNVPDSFIFGAIQGDGGTCATMPVIYVSIGRRLGYPLSLVVAKGKGANHCFARWDDPLGARFNIEGTNRGLSCPCDDYYRTGLYENTPDLEKKGCFLRSQKPREELAGFLSERFHCLRDQCRTGEAVEAMAWASALVPENSFLLNTLKIAINEWIRAVNLRSPPGFPEILIQSPRRRFPKTLPWDVEKNILGLEAVERLLDNPGYKRRWWDPLFNGISPARVPTKALVDYYPNGCQIRLQFSLPTKIPSCSEG